MATSDTVRWGILAPGGIAQRLLADAERGANFKVVAVGSRSVDRARDFAARHAIGRAYGTYEELLADLEVDAVYIGLPNSLHHEWTMKCLSAGKHVLCEKPYTGQPTEVTEAFDAAEARGLQLMEAFMWRHAPKTRRFLELLPGVGEIQSIRAAFSFAMDRTVDVRLDPELAGGALMDVGCYAISGSRLVAGEDPSRVFGVQRIGPSGVDIRFWGILEFGSGLVSEIVAGFTADQRSLEVVGNRGTLVCFDPWLDQLGGIELDGRPQEYERDDPYRLEMEDFSAAVLGRGKPLLGRVDALGQARTIEALRRSAVSGQPVDLAR